MSDLKKYIAKRKQSDAEFTNGFAMGYQKLKLKIICKNEKIE